MVLGDSNRRPQWNLRKAPLRITFPMCCEVNMEREKERVRPTNRDRKRQTNRQIDRDRDHATMGLSENWVLRREDSVDVAQKRCTISNDNSRSDVADALWEKVGWSSSDVLSARWVVG